MVALGDSSSHGVPPFHVHPGHAFDGFELIEPVDGSPVLLARCQCGSVLDLADAQFVPCPDCAGANTGCGRCGCSGEVIDHAALQWRPPEH